MLKIEKAQAVITSITCKDAPSPAPSKAGSPLTMQHHAKCVIALDVTENPKLVEALFPGADTAIKLTAANSDNKGWTQTAKTRPGAHVITVRGSDGQQFELIVDVKGGVQLKVSSQNSKKTNQATVVLRTVGRYSDIQKQTLDALLMAYVKVWLSPSQTDFSDVSGEKVEAKAKKSKKVQETAEEAMPALRAVPA